MNIVDLILIEPEQANSAVAASLQARVFDYLDNYQLAEEEQLDELSQQLKNKYVKAASKDLLKTKRKDSEENEKDPGGYQDSHQELANWNKAHKRQTGIQRALESEEHIDEGSGPKEKQKDKFVPLEKRVVAGRKSIEDQLKQEAGKTLLKKLTKESLDDMDQEEFDALVEDFEQLDELSKATLGSYIKKAAVDAKFKGFDAGYAEASAAASSKKMGGGSGAGMKDDDKAHSRLKGVKTAVNKLIK